MSNMCLKIIITHNKLIINHINLIMTTITPHHHQAYSQQIHVDIDQNYYALKISFKELIITQLHYQLRKFVKMSTCRKSPNLILHIILNTIHKIPCSC